MFIITVCVSLRDIWNLYTLRCSKLHATMYFKIKIQPPIKKIKQYRTVYSKNIGGCLIPLTCNDYINMALKTYPKIGLQ